MDDRKGTDTGDGLTRTMDVIVIRDSRKSINDPGQPSCKPRPSAPAALRYRGPSSTVRAGIPAIIQSPQRTGQLQFEISSPQLHRDFLTSFFPFPFSLQLNLGNDEAVLIAHLVFRFGGSMLKCLWRHLTTLIRDNLKPLTQYFS